jgi:hypothetical protein
MLAGNAAAQAPGQPPAAAPGQTIVVVQQPGYGQPPAGYTPPPAGYGQPPPGYGQVPPGYPQAPPGTYYAPAPGYAATPALGPKVLEYEEGDTIPPGYRTGTRVRKGLVIGGSVMLGVGYLLTIMTAGIGQLVNNVGDPGTKDFGPLLIPVVGPFIGMGTTHPSTGGVFGLAFLGVAQTAGLGMLIGGIAAPKTVLLRNEVAGVKLTVTPQFGPGTAGLGAVGSF